MPAKDRTREHADAKARRAVRIAIGLCPECGEPAAPGGKKCATHRDAANAARNAKRAARRDAGLCTDCGEPAVVGKAYCETHLEHRSRKRREARNPERERAEQRARREARKARGECTECGEPAAPGRTMCEPHLEQRRVQSREGSRRRYYQRKAAGLCYRCGKVSIGPPDTSALCKPCDAAMWRNKNGGLNRRLDRERTGRQYHERRAAGLCVRCGKAPARENLSTCEPCATRDAAGERRRKPGGTWDAYRERLADELGFVLRDLRRFNRWYLVEPDAGLVFGPYDTEQDAAADRVFRRVPFAEISHSARI